MPFPFIPIHPLRLIFLGALIGYSRQLRNSPFRSFRTATSNRRSFCCRPNGTGLAVAARLSDVRFSFRYFPPLFRSPSSLSLCPRAGRASGQTNFAIKQSDARMAVVMMAERRERKRTRGRERERERERKEKRDRQEMEPVRERLRLI